jgi:hypothetical protein
MSSFGYLLHTLYGHLSLMLLLASTCFVKAPCDALFVIQLIPSFESLEIKIIQLTTNS